MLFCAVPDVDGWERSVGEVFSHQSVFLDCSETCPLVEDFKVSATKDRLK